MNPIHYCPRCGGRMYCEDLDEWACWDCGERIFLQSGFSRLLTAIADQADRDRRYVRRLVASVRRSHAQAKRSAA